MKENSLHNLLSDTENLPAQEELNNILSSDFMMNQNEDFSLFVDENTNALGGNPTRISLLVSTKIHVSLIDFNFQNVQGQKRQFEQNMNLNENDEDSHASHNLPLNDIENLKRKCTELEAKVKIFEAE